MNQIQGVNLANLHDWDIVVAEDAIPSERYAAEEFHNFFHQAGGVALPIETRPARPDRHIIIGPQAARQEHATYAGDGFGAEDFRIVIRTNVIVIAGGRPRGTLYGVYAFLEDYLGVRFLAADYTHVPPIGKWRVIGPIDRRYHPPFAFRWPYYYETNNDPVMATRQRTNTVQTDLPAIQRPFMRHPPIAQDGRPFRHTDPKFGGVTTVQLVGHSFYQLLPAEELGQEHPEYFCEIDGKRRALQTLDSIHGLQPCLSSPEVLRIVTERVLEQLASNPGLKFVIVGQNDNQYYCRCAQCRAIDEREGSPMGSLLIFVNAVADAVAQKHPDVLVGTLAYQYSRQPPQTVKPRPNVYIQLCTIECCTIHAITDPHCPHQVKFREDMAAWGKICDRIGIWNYLTNFSSYMSPCPNLRSLEANVRFLAANQVKGMFMQAVYDTPAGEMSDLRNYLISCMLWDPNRNARQWMNEFIDLYYGPAGGPIRAYLDMLHDQVMAKHIHAGCFGPNEQFGIDDQIIQLGWQRFAEAEQLADNDIIRARVEKASICVYRAAIDSVFHTKAKISREDRQKLEPLVRRFFELCRKYRVLKIRECPVQEWRPVAAEIRQVEKIIEKLEATTGLQLS